MHSHFLRSIVSNIFIMTNNNDIIKQQKYHNEHVNIESAISAADLECAVKR